MRNPHYEQTPPLFWVSLIGQLAREIGRGLGHTAGDWTSDPQEAIRRAGRRARTLPRAFADEVNDRLITNPAFQRIERKVSAYVKDRWGETWRHRVDRLFLGTLPEKGQTVRRLYREALADLKRHGRQWQERMDRQTEQFFRMLGENLDRQTQVMRAYDTLGLKPGADEASIKERHRDLSRRYHPDRPDGQLDRMQRINEAYTVLMKYGVHRRSSSS